MARDFARSFYNSKKWKDCRRAYLSTHPYCERCLSVGLIEPAEQVHHRIPINTPERVRNASYSLSEANLEALCASCHSKETNAPANISDGLLFDENGDIRTEEDVLNIMNKSK